jgi:hypothetical protein
MSAVSVPKACRSASDRAACAMLTSRTHSQKDAHALPWFPSRLVVSLSVLIGLVLVPPGARADTTTATVYRAFTPHGFVKVHTHTNRGSCFAGSLTAPRRDAWRCIVGNYIHDPCFALTAHSSYVICPDAPWRKTGTKISLTEVLPQAYRNHKAPSTTPLPWAVELSSGERCLFLSGATTVVEGERLNYLCGGEEGLWGYPYRGAEPWTILQGPSEAHELSERVAIRHAWM